jgi:hypothetical protein
MIDNPIFKKAVQGYLFIYSINTSFYSARFILFYKISNIFKFVEKKSTWTWVEA